MKRNNRDARSRSLAGLLSLSGADSKYVRTIEVVDDQPRETLRTFTERYNEEQKIEAANRMRAERIAAAQTLLTQPSAYLSENCGRLVTEGKAPQQIVAEVRSAFTTFRNELSAKDITITDSGLKKFDRVCGDLNPKLDWTDVNTFRKTFSLMQDGEILDSTDIVDLSEPEPEQEVQPTQTQDFDSLDTQSAKDAVLSAVQSDCKEWFQGWEATILRDFGIIFTDAQTTAIVKFLQRGMVNYRSANGWHTVRRACVAAGTLPSNLLYPAEIFDQQIESSDLNDFDQKQAYAREFYKLQQLPNAGAPPQFYPSYS